ncbi:MAG: hypothetical protein H6654_11455 [Ardenticatenaceae bacterium]|nr:hypothetical protein [Anaerolineales bacterium]MCB8937596.1 hypothetical protein [Ardenticatenaceae bacterium]MCB8974165.1 hypothetical protein [Ardenticatenaceae bacterium]
MNYDDYEPIRIAVNRLTELLEWLHPEPSPDIFTVRDYRTRYPFTRLGPLAVGDIDRYRRINLAYGDQVQIGLCDYHIGLIYLHEGAFHGAVQQFELARQQWSFVNQAASVGLTHLARAVALQLAGHYEASMISVGRVRRWLVRAEFDKPVLGWPDFLKKVLEYEKELQIALRKQMEQGSKLANPGDDDDQPDGDDGAELDTSPPINNMGTNQPPVPVPGHRQISQRYEWYVVEWRPASGLLPEINSGDWLLVDLQPDLTEHVQDTEQPILVVMDEKIEGTIRVRPFESRGRHRIYLATLEDSPTGQFWLDEETGTVTFSAEMVKIDVNRNEILGVVVGFWRPMFEQTVS